MSIFDSDEFDVFHFRVFPLKGDAPKGFPGVCVDGVFRGSFELVVVEGGDEQKGFFIDLIEGCKALEGFDGVESSKLVNFFPAQVFAKKEFLNEGVCEALDHREEIH